MTQEQPNNEWLPEVEKAVDEFIQLEKDFITGKSKEEEEDPF